jgi:acyl-CoA reductase-like NAD-dependent aldehyde dehydrogenase
MAPKRIFVSAACATELEGRLSLSLRSSRRQETQTTSADRSLLTSVATEQLRPLLHDALARGAHLIAGEIGSDGNILVPLVLGGVAPSSRLLRESVFAPVLAIVTVADDHEAVLRANDCPFALAASVFSRDETAAREIAGRLRAGLVTINDLILPAVDARTPFGGRGRSGFGTTQGAEGLLELTVPKVITVTRGNFRPAFDPPHPADEQLFGAYLTLTHGRGLKARWQALVALAKEIYQRRKTSSPETI